MDNLNRLIEMLGNTSPEAAQCQMECQILDNGEKRWYRFICRTMWEDGPESYTGVLGKIVDIDEEYTEMLRLKRQATSDALTGLNNQAAAREAIIGQLIRFPERELALSIFDLDHFRTCNAVHGYRFGDGMLRHIAGLLSEIAGEEAVCARVGGDEFLLSLPYEKGQKRQTMERVFRMLSGAYQGIEYSIGMGVATTEVVERDYDLLFDHANRALYGAKLQGGSCVYFYDDSVQKMPAVLSAIESDSAEGETLSVPGSF